MLNYVMTHLEDQFFKSFGQLVREKQQTILAEKPRDTIPAALVQMHDIEKLLNNNQNRRHKYAIKIEEHLKELYTNRTGQQI